MPKRSWSTLSLLAFLGLGLYLAFHTARLYQYRSAFAGSYTYNLLFSSYAWSVPIAIFLGIFAGASSRRQAAKVENGKILRHDGAAFLIHWAHALSTLLLVASGIYLGFLFIPRLAGTVEMVGLALNSHFLAALLFLFSIAFHLTDLYLTRNLSEHMPGVGDFKDAVAHYASKVGIGQKPIEGKYLSSERLSYPLWIISVGLIVATGLIKVSAHIWSLPGALMGTTTLLHDVGALLVMANLAVHIVLSSIAPWSWPLLKSMLTGYVTEDYVRKHHAKWYAELTGAVPVEKGGKFTGTSVSS